MYIYFLQAKWTSQCHCPRRCCLGGGPVVLSTQQAARLLDADAEGADWREVARVVRREPHSGAQRPQDRRHAPLRPRRPVRAGEILRDHHATQFDVALAIRGMELNIAGASHGFFAAVAPGRTQRKRPRRGGPGPSTWKVRQPSGVKEDAKTVVAINRPHVQLYQGLELV